MNRPLEVGTTYICDYGCKHGFTKTMDAKSFDPVTVWQECKCHLTYGKSMVMRDWLRQKGHRVLYNSDITEQMRDEYLAFNPQWGTKANG